MSVGAGRWAGAPLLYTKRAVKRKQVREISFPFGMRTRKIKGALRK